MSTSVMSVQFTEQRTRYKKKGNGQGTWQESENAVSQDPETDKERLKPLSPRICNKGIISRVVQQRRSRSCSSVLPSFLVAADRGIDVKRQTLTNTFHTNDLSFQTHPIHMLLGEGSLGIFITIKSGTAERISGRSSPGR